jgi:hypothetical protein
MGVSEEKGQLKGSQLFFNVSHTIPVKITSMLLIPTITASHSHTHL